MKKTERNISKCTGFSYSAIRTRYIWKCSVLFLFFSGIAQAEVAPREYERIAKDLSQALGQIPNLAKPEVKNLDELVSRRDPLRPLIDSEGNPVKGTGFSDGPALQGIVRSEGFTRALIDDQLYSEGDAVGPFKLRKIREDGIELEGEGAVSFLPLYPSADAKKAKQ